MQTFLPSATAPSPQRGLKLSISRKLRGAFWSVVTKLSQLRVQRGNKGERQKKCSVLYKGRLLLTEVTASVPNQHTEMHKHARRHTRTHSLTWAWEISNLGSLQGSGYCNDEMSLQRKNPATPTIQDNWSLSILTGWKWRFLKPKDINKTVSYVHDLISLSHQK